MVMAYGALANGGRLMEPHLVRELRDPRGKTVFRSHPRVVRQVVSPSVARRVARVLEDVVEDGTGTEARLATFAVAGKSGTSRVYDVRGGYERGAYYASFVCFFPVEDPQLVVYVKLERPQGTYYGGATAAPVTRATLEAVLAARQAPIDREAVASPIQQQPRTSPIPGARFASLNPSPLPPARTPRAQHPPETGATVPDVSGLPPRLAARQLHAQGFRVLLEGPGRVTGSRPPPGTALARGDTVRVLTGGSGDG
jgi:membrane peptidoglycan carboxypeptidase